MEVLKSDIMDYKFLGSGFPMFYNFIKYCILLLLSLFIIEAAPGVVTNFNGTFCTSTEIEEAHW